MGNISKQLISAQECNEILWKAVRIQANEADIRYEFSVIENSFGYIADLAHLTIWIEKVCCFRINRILNSMGKKIQIQGNQ